MERTSSRAPGSLDADDGHDLAGAARAGRCRRTRRRRASSRSRSAVAASAPRCDRDRARPARVRPARDQPGGDALLGQRLALEHVGADAVEDQRDPVGVLGQLGDPVGDEQHHPAGRRRACASAGRGRSIPPGSAPSSARRTGRPARRGPAPGRSRPAAGSPAGRSRERPSATSRIARSAMSARSAARGRGPAPRVPSRPTIRFSATVRFGKSCGSWWTTATRSRSVAVSHGRPSSSMSPSSASVSPARILMSVLLPAPFGPAMPRISPRPRVEVEPVEGARVAVPLAQAADAQTRPSPRAAGRVGAPSPARRRRARVTCAGSG